MKFYCGSGCANCCLVISIWAIIQLGVMGMFFQQENIGLNHDFEKGKGGEVAMNCWVACGMYAVTLALSVYSIIMNNRDAASQKADGYRAMSQESLDH